MRRGSFYNMDAISIKKNLKTGTIGKKIYFYGEIDSTNNEAKRLAKLGVGEGAVVIADHQTSGRGKFRRHFFSPKGSGIYLTIIIEPFKVRGKTLEITLLGTLASARAISGLTGEEVRVKWPNDIMIRGKKVGGVLTEVCSGKTGRGVVIVGIGLNVSTRSEKFPEEIKGLASSIDIESGKRTGRTKIIQRILEEFEALYFLFLAGKEELILNEWKILSETIGRNISIRSHDAVYEGRAVGIDGGGQLILKIFGGSIRKFDGGDIIIK
jgi:BirA family biotin operon repressor/biotin-[acetyl-CoA-carboxylase] ligase